MKAQNGHHLLAVGLIGLALILGGFLAVPGIYNIDETIYYLAADALARTGSLIVQTGFERFGAEGLRLLYLTDGPNGLAPQYPVGPTLLGAPLLAIFGVRGLILLNAVSAAAAVLLTRALALRLGFGRGEATGAVLILIFGTFFVEYAYAIRPHLLQTALALGALWAAAGVITGKTAAPRRDALLSGLCIGTGLLVRPDTVLLLPAIGAMAILYAPRPITTLALGAAGLLPGVLAGAVVNAYKFGTWNPLSYGTSGGGTDPTRYLGLLPVIVLLPLALAGFRRLDWRPSMRWPLLGISALVMAAALLLSPLHDPLLRFLRGYYTLAVDLRLAPEARSFVEPQPDGTVTFYGLWQKALGQSMPWLGVLALLAVRPWGGRRRAYLLVGLVCLFWMLPFAMISWTGGLGSNMRYFMPLLPLLSIVPAGLWSDLLDGAPASRLLRDLLIGVAIAALAIQGWLMVSATGLGGVQQILSIYMLAALAAASLATGAGLLAARHTRLLLAACFVIAIMQNLVIDFSNAQIRRARTLETERILAQLPPKSLVVGPPELFTLRPGGTEDLVAVPRWTDNGRLDTRLYSDALSDGYRVFIFKQIATDNGITPAAAPIDTPFGELVELTAAELPG